MVENGTKIKVKIYACQCASGENSIIEKLAMAYPNANITGPTTNFSVNYNYIILEEL